VFVGLVRVCGIGPSVLEGALSWRKLYLHPTHLKMSDKFPWTDKLEEEYQQKLSYLNFKNNQQFHCKVCNRTYKQRYYNQHQKIKVHKNTT
jgi:hypothetical protein